MASHICTWDILTYQELPVTSQISKYVSKLSMPIKKLALIGCDEFYLNVISHWQWKEVKAVRIVITWAMPLERNGKFDITTVMLLSWLKSFICAFTQSYTQHTNYQPENSGPPCYPGRKERLNFKRTVTCKDNIWRMWRQRDFSSMFCLQGK